MLARKFRPFALALGAFVLLALVTVTALRVYGGSDLEQVAAAFEAEVYTLDLSSHARPEIPAAKNAAHWIQAGSAALALEEPDKVFLKELFQAPPGEFAVDQARDLLTINRPALDLLHRATELKEANYHLDYAAGFEMEIPNLLQHLEASRMLLLEVRLAIHDGHWDEALKAHAAQRRIAEVLYEETPLIFQLVGRVTEISAWKGVQLMLAAGLADEETLSALCRPLDTLSAADRFRRSMGGEAAIFYQWRDEPEKIREMAESLGWLEAQNLKHRTHTAVAGVLEGFRLLATGYGEHTAVELADNPQLNGPHVFGSLGQLVGNLADAAYKLKHGEAVALLADQALALRLEAVKTGRYPATWPAVESPYSGDAFLYQRNADGSVTLSAPSMVATLERLRPNGPPNSVDRWELPAP